jgi:Ca2+-binding RTX toxin-like protein
MGSARIKSGGAGADVISAADRMTFDWVPDAGNSWEWASSYFDDVLVWDDYSQEYHWEYTSLTRTGTAPSTAHGSVGFDTPAFAQTFTAAGPSEFEFRSTTAWGDNTTSFYDYAGEGNRQWTWNPVSGKLDPIYAASSPAYDNYITYRADKVHLEVSGYDVGHTEIEHGHWALRHTADLIAHGGAGNDKIYGGTGNDKLFGEAGDDEIHGGLGTAFLSGGQGKDLLIGGIGEQTLNGGQGDDILIGGTGKQTLMGGAGNDTLHDATGDTTLSGGAGTDTFVFKTDAPGNGNPMPELDTVLDFNPSRDHIRLEARDGSAGSATLLDNGGSAVLDLGNAHRVLLVGVDASQLEGPVTA